MRYSIEPRDRIYVKGYGFLSFAKNIGKTWAKACEVSMGKRFLMQQISRQQMPLRLTLKRAIQKIVEATVDLVGNKIAEKIAKATTESIQED